MTEPGLDNWCMRMEEHKRKGHQMIQYPGITTKNKINMAEGDLLIK